MKTVKTCLMVGGVYLVWRSTLPYTRAFCYGVKEGWNFAEEHGRGPNDAEMKQIIVQHRFAEQLREL